MISGKTVLSKSLRNTLIKALFVASLAFWQEGTSPATCLEKSFNLSAKKSLMELMKKQERILGIKHIEQPEISFYSFDEKEEILAEYDSEKDKIILDPEFLEEEILSHELGHRYSNRLIKNLRNLDWPDYSEHPSGFGEGDRGKCSYAKE